MDLRLDKFIEIAVLVTDADLNILGDGVDLVIHADDAASSSTADVVTDMHTAPASSRRRARRRLDPATAEKAALDYCHQHVKQAQNSATGGNSIATVRGFIARDMPALDSSCTTG